jgi:hypothetical protein
MGVYRTVGGYWMTLAAFGEITPAVPFAVLDLS